MDPATMAAVSMGVSAAMDITSKVIKIVNAPKSEDAIRLAQSGGYIDLLTTNGSITKLLSKFIVEPTIIVSNSLKDEEVTEKLANINVDLFASYYLQAFEVLRTLYGVEERMIIDLLGTHNGALNSVSGTMRVAGNINRSLSREDLDVTIISDKISEPASLSLERFNNNNVKSRDDKMISYSSVIQKEIEITFPVRTSARKTKNESSNEFGRSDSTTDGTSETTDESTTESNGTSAGTTESSSYNENNNYTGGTDGKNSRTDKREDKKNGKSNTTKHDHKVDKHQKGKDAQAVEIHENTEYVVIPILIKANVIYTDVENIINMAEPGKADTKLGYRLDEYRSGGITLSEFLFATDLVKRYKKNKLKDKDGLMDAIHSKVNSGNSKLVTHGVKGYENNYNMYLVSSDDKVAINKHLNQEVTKHKYMQQFLDQIYGMSLSLVDLDYERVSLYTKDIKGKSDISFKGLNKRKESGDNYTEMVKAIMANRPVTF